MRAGSTTFVGGLEGELALGDGRWAGVPVHLGADDGEDIVHGGSRFELFFGFTGKLVVGLFLEPFGAVLRRLGEEILDDDDGGGGDAPALAFALQGDGGSGADEDPEAHDGLVNGTDFLHVESSVADAFAVEEHQVAQDTAQGAVADEGEVVGGMGLVGRAPFEEREAVGIEQMAVSGGHGQLAVATAAVDDSEQGQQPGPCAVAGVHLVGELLVVGAELLEQAVDGVMAEIGTAAGHEAAVLGEQEEDEAQEDGEEALVDLVGVVAEGVVEDAALDVVGGLEPAEDFVQGEEDLLGEEGGDGGLVFAAGGQQTVEVLAVGGVEDGLGPKKRVEGAENEASPDLGHGLDREGDVARVLLGGRVNEAEVGAVGEDADVDLGIPQESLELLAGRRVPGARMGGMAFVEVAAVGDFLDEQHPRRGIGLGLESAQGEGGRQGFVEVGQDDGEVVGDGVGPVFADDEPGGPTEELLAEQEELGDAGGVVVLGTLDGNGGNPLPEAFLKLGQRALVDLDAGVGEGLGGDDEALGLEVAEPCLVIRDVG